MHLAPMSDPVAPASRQAGACSRVGRWFPWRSASLGWVATGVILALGVPLFLRMPLWCDATLYDVAARAILRGGAHYRDVFDTNPPGFPWIVCGIRAVLGPSSEALRAVDLLFVAAVTALLLRWARLGGASPAGCAWAAAAIAGFYLFSSEFNHAQRDVWMMLPAVAASLYRIRRIERAWEGPASDWRVLRGGFCEGLIWGCGFWVKPHVGLIGVVVWLVCAVRFAATASLSPEAEPGSGRRSRRLWRGLRRLGADLLGVFLGVGLLVLLGIGWLVSTGSWDAYLDVNRNWNTGYWQVIWSELSVRMETRYDYFPPWTTVLRLALPLALLNLIDGLVRWPSSQTGRPSRGLLGRWVPGWVFETTADERQRFVRAVLAAATIGWFEMSLYLQRGFHYAHIPEVFLMLALFAANRWAVAFLLVVTRVGAGLFLLYAADHPEAAAWHQQTEQACWVYRDLTYPNPAFDWKRTAWWPHCFDREVPRELRRDQALLTGHFANADPVELGAVEDYLRAQGVTDRQVLCWHDSTHPLYLWLDVEPPIRFMHLSTVMGMGKWQHDQIGVELRRALPDIRYVVSDMHRVTQNVRGLSELDPDGLPRPVMAWQRSEFPFDQPVVFRSPSNRYLVHLVVNPLNSYLIPKNMDQPERSPDE